MKVRRYKNFDELFYNLNREILKTPQNNLDYTVSAIGYADDVVIQTESHDCTLNLADFGYKMAKWTRTVNAVVGKINLYNFHQELKLATGNCCMFNFYNEGMTKGGSLISIVLRRHDKRCKWKECTVFFRTVEVEREFAIYLVLLHTLLRDLPKSCCNVSDVTLFVTQMSASAVAYNAFLEYFDLGIEELDETHPFIKAMKNAKQKYFTEGCKLSNYNVIKRLQNFYFNKEELPKIRVMDLEILEND